jgi:SAM-dependent methyltransferase
VALADNSCDGALCTFTLCTIPGVEQALAELRRVLKPGGRFHFLEHGLAPDAKTQTWQRRLDPLEKRLADGCHLTRDPVELVKAAGFQLEFVHSEYTKGPKPWVFMTFAQAINPG